MKTKLFICLFSACTTSDSFAAWIWDQTGSPVGSEITLADGTSGTFSRTPVSADYDTANANDGRGFDQAPAPVSFAWDSGGQPIQITLDSSGSFFDFDLDPDGNGQLPTSVSFDVIYTTAVSDRGIDGGGLLTNVNPLNSTLDFQLTVFDALLDQINLSDSNNFRTSFRAPSPTSFPGGSVFYDDVINVNTNPATQNAFPGLTNGGFNASDAFPRSNPNSDPTLAVGGVSLLFTDLGTTPARQGTEFRLSFDGGVTENALTVVPEPSVPLLSSFVLLGLLRRRRKS